MTQTVNEVHIQLKEHGAVVNNLWNGMSVSRNYISPTDLALSMLDILEDSEIIRHLLSTNTLVELFTPYLEADSWDTGEHEEDLIQIIDMITGNVPDYGEKAVKLLFTQLSSRFNPMELSVQETNKILKVFIDKFSRTNFSGEYEYTLLIDLFCKILEKVNLLGDRSVPFLSPILRKIYQQANFLDDKEIINSLFEVTASKADKSAVLRVLEPYIKKERVCSSPLLPKNCFIYQEMLDGRVLVGIEVEAQRFDVKYHRRDFKQVGHPNMLFLFKISGQEVLMSQLVCIKDKLLKPTTQLYRYPFSNVFKSLSCCWPDLQSYKVKDLSMVGTLPYAFINSPNNDHAYFGENLGEKFYFLQDNDFNHEDLTPIEDGLTLSDWLELQKFEKK
ncbi:hypothetical protein [Bacillus sp. AFS040349]|uniref:hypothetical protein n=1 Tax=Bacillus sp. AFS040349 TaxID=2033502 RepID=UPI000BFDEB09|nr:hypothetical protein [Bacillus sp. AFS040349]PGT81496.1 hypothetical protein COD11_17345 [Bacillus sp. AFS040349]